MKNFIMKIVLHFLYRGIKVLATRDSVVKEEINALPNGYKVKIETDLNNPKTMCFSIVNGKVIKLKKNSICDLTILFKNKSLAFIVFSGQKSISDAYCEHYFQMFGNIYTAMGVTRILERVEGYLFPKFINKKILKQPFKREISIVRTYLLCIF